jgi:hypothetical protein
MKIRAFSLLTLELSPQGLTALAFFTFRHSEFGKDTYLSAQYLFQCSTCEKGQGR